MPELQFEYSSWLVVVCMILGLAYAYALYSKKSPWSKSINRMLSFLRFAVVSFLLILLLNPLIKQLISSIEKPVMLVAIDNSKSITNVTDSTERSNIFQNIQGLISEARSNGFEVETRSFDQENVVLSEVNFDQKTSDLNAMLRDIETLYDSKNLESVLLVSDGNYNLGISPSYFPYGFKINTLGIGDTTSHEDLFLKNVRYNKIAYQGNKFPIVAEVSNISFLNKTAKVTIKQGGNTIASENITLNNTNGFTKVEFEIEANKNGIQHFVVQAEIDGDKLTQNNRKDVFIDIIDGRQKILMVALAPHPDVKALRSVIENNENYEFDIFIPGIGQLKEEKYDLVIVHQAGDRFNRLAKIVEKFNEKNVPILNILGQFTNVVKLSNDHEYFNFKSIRNQRDQVGPAINSDFSKFKINPDFNQVFAQFPTLNIPYGDLKLGPEASVLLYQKIGSITTEKPLLYLIDQEDSKTAYLLADGIWQWRFQEYALNENTETFDDIFLKLVQYLSTKEDKRKFRVKTSKDQFYDNELITFETELYNDSYERVYGNTVRVKITGENGNSNEYSFVPSSINSQLEISGLEQGIYQYNASVERNGKTEDINGRFTIKKLQLELLDQVANYSLLQQVADNTEGQFYTMSNFDQLTDDYRLSDSKAVLHSTEDLFAMINLRWLFFLVLILLSTEWFTRKYSGGY